MARLKRLVLVVDENAVNQVLKMLTAIAELSQRKIEVASEDEIEAILYPNFKQVNEHKFVYNTSEIKANVAKVIAENYNQLRSKFVGNTQYLQLSQIDEDLFHNTLLKVISEGIEDNVLEQIEYRIKMLRFQLKMDNKQLKGIYANSEQTEKARSEESEY